MLVVTRLDRLARSTRDLLNILDTVAKAGAGFRSLADAWADTTTPHGRRSCPAERQGAEASAVPPLNIKSLPANVLPPWRTDGVFEDDCAKLRKKLRRIVHHRQHREHKHHDDDRCPRAKAELINPIAHGMNFLPRRLLGTE